MSMLTMPMVLSHRVPGVRSDITNKSLNAWNPEIRAAAKGQSKNTISILDTIGKDWDGEGVTAKRIGAALRSIGDQDVEVHINSPGGDLFEGLAIYAQLREHPGKVTVKILGVAASAASVIAMAANEVQIMRSGFVMIHNAWVMAAGDKNALRDVADWLEPFDHSLADIYTTRTGIKRSEVSTMLDKETWIGGAAAVETGFADSFLASDQAGQGSQNGTELSPEAARKKADILMARGSAPRSMRRELLAALKGGTHNAAPTDTPRAVEPVASAVDRLLAELKTT